MSVEKQSVKKALEEIALEEPEFIVRLFASLPQDQLARLVAALPPRALKEAVIDETAGSLWPAWRRWSPAG